MVVISALFLLCLIAYFMRKRSLFRTEENNSPQLLDRTRNFLFRNLLLNDGSPDWMCIICGFDNKPRNAHCIMCGTAHEFSKDYKTKKFETKRLKKELKAAKDCVTQKPKVDVKIPQEAQITSVSSSLKYFNSAPEGLLSPEKRREAMNYRRLNQLTLRQKSARRRKMWQRRIDPVTGALVWVRVPIHKTTVGSAPFGYTPRQSISEYPNELDSSMMSTSGTTASAGGKLSIFSTLSGLIKGGKEHDPEASQSLLSDGSRPHSFSSNQSAVSNLQLFDPVADLLAAASSPIKVTKRSSGPGEDSSPRKLTSIQQRSAQVTSPYSPRRRRSRDSFDDSVLVSHSPGYTSVFDEDGELVWEKVVSGVPNSAEERRNSKVKNSGVSKEGPTVTKYISNTRGPYQQNNYFPRQQRLYRQPQQSGDHLQQMPTIHSADSSPVHSPHTNAHTQAQTQNERANSTAASNLFRMFSSNNNSSEGNPPRFSPPPSSFPAIGTDEETGLGGNLRAPLLSSSAPAAPPTIALLHPTNSNPAGDRTVSSSGNPSRTLFPPSTAAATGRTPSPMTAMDAGAEDIDLSTIAAMTYRSKLLWFLDRLAEFQVAPSEGYIKIEVRRNRLLEDSHSVLTQFQPEDLHKYMRIEFHGEPGVDAGGLEREWFAMVAEAILMPEVGLFTCSGSDALGAYHINPTSSFKNLHHLSYFRFIGRFIGKAILGQQSINMNFSVPLRKQMLSMPVTFSDLEFVDEELHRNLVWLKENDNVSNLMLYFSISYPGGDNQAPVEYELKPGGADIAVTDENKEEYLQLRLRHRLLDSIKPQLENLLIGLYEVIPADLLSVFDYQELDLLLCGVPDIDITDWKDNTEYMGLYRKQGANHKVIRWFWAAVETMSHEERIRLLQYTTGCSRLPAQGFKALQSTDGRYRRFNIQSIFKTVSIRIFFSFNFSEVDLNFILFVVFCI